MTTLFLDTNALMKLYISEIGSMWLQNYVLDKQKVISQLAFSESATTLGRLYRSGLLTRKNASTLYARIWNDSSLYDIIPTNLTSQRPLIVSLAFNLPLNLRIRALDAIQLTSASIAQQKLTASDPDTSFIFVSSDVQLLRVAQAQGFATENPEDHP